ncbi:MAG: hypothetical protein KKH72_05410 [Alphaproteobacteria bacterium]|nr:hypothetical protein [Alphaproteobacteria bacterium]
MANPARGGERLYFADYARGGAMMLAVIAHVLATFTPGVELFLPVTMMATPTFLAVFGMMVEVVYLRKIREGADAGPVRVRLLTRALVCYGAFLIISLSTLVGGRATLAELATDIVTGNTLYGPILIAYAVLLAALALLLPLAGRFGSAGVFIVVGLAWAARLVVDALDPVPNAFWQGVFGHGHGAAPSILPAITFVWFGMLLAEIFTGRRSAAWLFAIVVPALALVSAVLALSPFAMSPGRLLLHLRYLNDPVYYAYGFVAATLALGLAWWAQRRFGPEKLAFLGTFGTASLFFYVTANAGLNLLPESSATLPPAIGIGVGVLFLAGMTALAYDWVAPVSRVDRLLFGLPKRAVERFVALSTGVARRIIGELDAFPWHRVIAPPRDRQAGPVRQGQPERMRDQTH